MSARSVLVASISALAWLGCGERRPAASPPAVVVAAVTDPAPGPASLAERPRGAACPEAPVGTEADYEQGSRLLEEARQDYYGRQAAYQQALSMLLRAAEQGHLEAQAKYGATRFSDLFQGDAPAPEERDAYVSALTQLFIAARRGHEGARETLPGLADLRLEGERLTSRPAYPLSDLDEAWIREALRRAGSWTCPVRQ